MTDLSRAVQTAMFDVLDAADLGGLKVYTVVPDKVLPPCIVIAESSFEEIGGKGTSVELHRVVVRTFINGTSKLPLQSAMAAIKAALHDQPLTFAGALLSDCRFEFGGERRDLDEGTLVGEQSFQVIAQDDPAP